MKNINKVMAAMMIMAIACTIPTSASNKKFDNKKATVVMVDKKHDNRPDMRTCTIKVGRRNNNKRVMSKAKHIHGVKDVHFNPRTNVVTVRYDARMTSARHILRTMS